MSIGSRRAFRLSLTVALALVLAYAMASPLPHLAPIFAWLLTMEPKKPLGLKGLLVLVAVTALTTGTGLLMIPLLSDYPATAILVVLIALFFSTYISVSLGQVTVGMLLTIGITLISAVGTVSFAAATAVIEALVLAVVISVICQWLVYPLFPEDPGTPEPPAEKVGNEHALWISLRTTLIVLPVYLVCLTNPLMYTALILKSVSLGQQSTVVETKAAAKVLLGSTLMGGVLAILFWFALKLNVSLWMFFLWMLLIGIGIAAKIYRLRASKYSVDFWSTALVTMLILLGPAVADSANGKDVYQAFAVRMSLLVAVALYAWMTVLALDQLRTRLRWTSTRSAARSAVTTG